MFFRIPIFIFVLAGCVSYKGGYQLIKTDLKTTLIHSNNVDSLSFASDALVFQTRKDVIILRETKAVEFSDFSKTWNLRILTYKVDETGFLIKKRQLLMYKDENKDFTKKLDAISLRNIKNNLEVRLNDKAIQIKFANTGNSPKNILDKSIRKLLEQKKTKQF